MLDEQNVQDRVLTREEERLYLLASPQPLRDIATLVLQTGMRPEEVCRIRRENVHLDQDYLSNPHGKTPAAKRRVSLNRTAKEILARRLQQDGDYLFQGGVKGRPIVKVNARTRRRWIDLAFDTSRRMPCDIPMQHEVQWPELTRSR